MDLHQKESVFLVCPTCGKMGAAPRNGIPNTVVYVKDECLEHKTNTGKAKFYGDKGEVVLTDQDKAVMEVVDKM